MPSPMLVQWMQANKGELERSLHTGEVAGSIPAAPTIASIYSLSVNFGEHKFSQNQRPCFRPRNHSIRIRPWARQAQSTRAGGFVWPDRSPLENGVQRPTRWSARARHRGG